MYRGMNAFKCTKGLEHRSSCVSLEHRVGVRVQACISIREGGSDGGERIFKCTIAHPHSHKKNFITIRQTALSDSRNTHF